MGSDKSAGRADTISLAAIFTVDSKSITQKCLRRLANAKHLIFNVTLCIQYRLCTV